MFLMSFVLASILHVSAADKPVVSANIDANILENKVALMEILDQGPFSTRFKMGMLEKFGAASMNPDEEIDIIWPSVSDSGFVQPVSSAKIFAAIKSKLSAADYAAFMELVDEQRQLTAQNAGSGEVATFIPRKAAATEPMYFVSLGNDANEIIFWQEKTTIKNKKAYLIGYRNSAGQVSQKVMPKKAYTASINDLKQWRKKLAVVKKAKKASLACADSVVIGEDDATQLICMSSVKKPEKAKYARWVKAQSNLAMGR